MRPKRLLRVEGVEDAPTVRRPEGGFITDTSAAGRIRLIEELKTAMASIETLHGLLPICMSWKRVHDDKGTWEQVESYVSRRSEVQFSHGVCPECMKKLHVMEVLPKRCAKYGLKLHPEKTRLLCFRRPSDKEEDSGKLETFKFLGLTHFWAKSRTGYWVIKRKTAADRFARSLRGLSDWMRRVRHWP